MDFNELPVGFGMALSRNFPALNAWSALTEAQKQIVLERVHSAASQQEIHQIVNGLFTNGAQ